MWKEAGDDVLEDAFSPRARKLERGQIVQEKAVIRKAMLTKFWNDPG